MKKLLVFVFVCLLAQPALAADPLKVHEAGFGPEIRGLRLGKPMTWPEMLNAQYNIRQGPVAPVFGMYIADTYEAVNQQDSSPGKPGKWILVNFLGGKNAMIMNGGGGMLSEAPKSGSLNDFFAFLKKSGLNYASTPNITLRDERVIEYSVDKKDIPQAASTAGDFAQWLRQRYVLGTMEQKGEAYEAGNPSEGWRVVVTDSKATVFSMPIPDTPQK